VNHAAWTLHEERAEVVMGSQPKFALALALVWAPGCQGSFGAPERFREPETETGVVPTPACPNDPDCAISEGGECQVCPSYWICEEPPGGPKKCINPGPEYPDGGGDWECRDVANEGTIVTECRRPGSDFPDGGGGGEWDCALEAEFVVCTDDTPTYPDGGGPGTFDCWFEDEFRICESGGGDGGGWSCHDIETGIECRRDEPDFPDDGEWTCYDQDGETICTAPGGDLPDGGGGGEWDCVIEAEFVVCTDDTPDYPDDGGGGTTDCFYQDEFRVCRTPTPDGGGDECVPGSQRWCDDHIYCSWGKQTCLPDGRWGACIEPTVTRDGLADRPNTTCGCRFFYFNDDCCEDQTDANGDGAPDCIIPADHVAPACPGDGGLCSFCDSHTDCGGDADLCIFRTDGYAMCGRDCSTEGCPDGYACVAIPTADGGALHQCAPASGACE
jgi:hypothetical protein